MDQTVTFHTTGTSRPPMLEVVGRSSGMASA